MALSLYAPTLVNARLASRHRPPLSAPPSLPLKNPISIATLQCEHFNSCSGCSYELDLDRPPVLQEAEKFFKDLGVDDFTFDSCKLWEWRCRAKLAVRGSPDFPLIGLYQEGTHNVVDIPLCRAHHPNINAAVNLLKQGISALNIQPYDEDSETGELRYVQMAVTTYDTSLPAADRYSKGKVQISLVWNARNEKSQNFEKLSALSDFLWKNGGPSSNKHLIHSVWVNFQTSTSNVIFGNRWRHVLGEREFWEHIGGIDASLDPSSFGQANTQAFNSLLRRLQKYVPYGSSVVDLYAGAGIIGLSVAVIRKCRSLKCVEINKESKLSFEKSLSRLPRTVDCNISWHNTDASIEPLHWLEGSDVVIVDPPRKGLHPSVGEALKALSNKKGATAIRSSTLKVKDEKRPWILRAREASVHVNSKTEWEKNQTWPQTLIYISCGWESFKEVLLAVAILATDTAEFSEHCLNVPFVSIFCGLEDCNSLLSTKAWYLEKAHAFNFFPGTQSIEVLAVFKRGPRVNNKKKKTGKKKKS